LTGLTGSAGFFGILKTEPIVNWEQIEELGDSGIEELKLTMNSNLHIIPKFLNSKSLNEGA
jgi:hypothetical protein